MSAGGISVHRDAVIWWNLKLLKPNISRGSTSFLSNCFYHNTLPSVLCPVLPLHTRGTGCLGAQIQLKEEQSAVEQVFQYQITYALIDTGSFSQQPHLEAFSLVGSSIALMASVCHAFCDEKERKKGEWPIGKDRSEQPPPDFLSQKNTHLNVREQRSKCQRGQMPGTTLICNSVPQVWDQSLGFDWPFSIC